METRLNWQDYAVTWARLHGGFDPRTATPVVRYWLRGAHAIADLLGRLGVGPTAVTVAGVVLCLGVPVLAPRGGYGLLGAAALVLLAAVADTVDGALAVVTGRTSRLGYVYDSIADRAGEAFWLLGFWLAGAPGPLVVAAGALSWLHEYLRARAAAAGMREIGAVTVGERPTRVSAALVGLLLAGLAALVASDLAAGVLTVVTAVWVLLGLFGLTQLLTAVRRTLA
ncbi:CDP-alcohol phosphatidyltransferase family protein [Solwaraspora sp. WMMD406]|uniref:CDP-alcohol phosphatidyltransferase family protein n=1 Tax=Solwaraspora sp. WMMD406 TaxID=3016095 RepID=UPI0024176170|nr:CDP-alcohol phosphatidyltransferase family protein [Solwaraspora sp. WMMD406]MDG4765205.1 CDP-alcohol phosphatidyltransferase family protein [Solwaraspora sp. WMMD406]